MEELQDAIEDAQYVNAIATQEEGPRPVLSWEIPTEEQLAAWVAKIKKQTPYNAPQPFGVDWTFQSAVGLFLFAAFLKETCNDYPRINFIEDVIRWKKTRGKHRFERARAIFEVYLTELQVDPHTGAKMIPPKKEIEEFDLVREPSRIDPDDVSALLSSTIDPSKSQNCLGLKGAVIEEISDSLRSHDRELRQAANKSSSIPTEIEPNGDSAQFTKEKRFESLRELTQSWRENKNATETALSLDLFDKAEVVVVESLRREYWKKFLDSEYSSKLLNFLWFQDRPVVPDDFFNMRVLGRGGFGSVVGK